MREGTVMRDDIFALVRKRFNKNISKDERSRIFCLKPHPFPLICYHSLFVAHTPFL